MDLGGDKNLPCLALPKELNPFLGWRAVRIFLDRPDIMRPQLRAILRASAHGRLGIMFPMISAVEELEALRSAVEQCKAELRGESVAFDEAIEVGIMIETAAAALLAPHLARRADFFSIGTNDLTRYTLAVDRCNEAVAARYRMLSPAVLVLIRQAVVAAHAEHKRVGVCGELAGDARAIPLLVGLDVDELSMSAAALPRARMVVRALTMEAARALAGRALAAASAAEVEALLADFAADCNPSLA